MRPSLVPFLVSTRRPFRLKLRLRILLILIISSFAASSSAESITQPYLLYSRMDLTSRIFSWLLMDGPATRKAMILRLSGSTIVSEM